jgi:hypothetical protein
MRAFMSLIAILPLSLTSASAQNTNDPNLPYDPDPNTIALYHLDEGSGSIAGDASSHGLDATLMGATWTTEGRFAGGLLLDGDGYVALPSSDLYASEDLTLEAWIFMTDFDPVEGAIVVDGWFSAMNGGGRRLGIDAERRAFAVARVPLGPLSAAVATTQVPLDRWVHLAAVFDGGHGRIQVLVNGIIESDEPMTGGTNAHTQLTIGRELLSDYAGLVGTIDEVRVSDVPRALLAVPVGATSWGRIKALWQ